MTSSTITDAQIVRFLRHVADVTDVAPPRFSRVTEQAAKRTCGLYYPESRTIGVLAQGYEDPSTLPETLLHEFQHYLDDLYGTELRGSLRGRHDRSFYRRLDSLRESVAESVQSNESN